MNSPHSPTGLPAVPDIGCLLPAFAGCAIAGRKLA